MDDKFDKILANRIREVFDDYAMPPADEGWLKLREKFPPQEKKNKAAWLWWGSAAAILLAFLGIGIWLLNQKQPVDNTVHNKVEKLNQKDTATVIDNIAKNGTDHQATTITGDTDKAKQTAQVHHSAGTTIARGQNGLSPFAVSGLTKNTSAAATKATSPIDTSIPAVTNKPTDATIAATVTKPKTLSDSAAALKPANNPAVIAQQPVTKSEPPVNNTVATKQPQANKSIMELLAAEKTSRVAKKEEKKAVSKKVAFSIYAATYINYAQGSANQVNAGAGFTSDIRLAKNLKLSTGMSLAQNSLSYNNAPPTSAGGSTVSFSAAPSIVRKDLFSTASTVAEFKNYNARLVGLDIPLNLKYEFDPEKNDTYISAGLSSGTFIDERYTYNYQYRNFQADGTSTITSATVQGQEETANKTFNSFYFGKTLNFSFGVGYPLGKSNRLIIEPFLKYPLSGLGAQQIRFGAGGLNLKINFKSSKR